MTVARTRRRSRAVDLAILGATGGMMTGLGGCSNATYERNVYASMSDCASDYSLATCSAKGSQGPGVFLGPVYRLQNGRPLALQQQRSGRRADPGLPQDQDGGRHPQRLRHGMPQFQPQPVPVAQPQFLGRIVPACSGGP